MKKNISEEKETEEELKKRLKEEIMAELLEEMKSEKSSDPKKEKDSSISSSKKLSPLPESKVHFDSYNSKELESVNEMNRKDRKMKGKDLTPKKVHLPQASEDQTDSKSTTIILGLSVVILAVVIFFFPSIHRFLENLTIKGEKVAPVTNTNDNEPKYEKITVNSKVLETFTYPIMRNSVYAKNSYYQKDTITMSEFSNNDILYNAFIHVYTGSLAPYEGQYIATYCGTGATRKMVNEKYLTARIENSYSRKTNYKHATFVVPSTNKDTQYVGTWYYDAKNKAYIYYGDCNPIQPTDTLYYDLKNIEDASGNSNNTVIEVTYHIAFAEVTNSSRQYKIYSDATMTNVISSGTLTTNDYERELNQIFKDLSKESQVKSYKYTFSTADCAYQDYCFEKGEWIK